MLVHIFVKLDLILALTIQQCSRVSVVSKISLGFKNWAILTRDTNVALAQLAPFLAAQITAFGMGRIRTIFIVTPR